MTALIPDWGPLITFYDPTGQVPEMARTVSDDGMSIAFTLDRMTIGLNGDESDPFAGAVALSGALSVALPEDLNMLGFLLVVNGHLDRTPGSQAVVSCFLGHGADSIVWPLKSMAGKPTPDPDEPGDDGQHTDRGILLSEEFRVECFTSEGNPASVGVAPFPLFAPIPFTISAHARRRVADEAVDIGITDFTVVVIRS